MTAIEPDDKTRATGEIIACHIEMQDVRFEKSIRPDREPADVSLYLSVHHQWDPNYEKLACKVAELRKRTRRVLFVEVILPPLFGMAHTAEEVDRMVGGRVLRTYRHRLRGKRRIYRIEGEA